MPPFIYLRDSLHSKAQVAPSACSQGCTFRSIVQIRPFCLRVFVPFGATLCVISPGSFIRSLIQLKNEF